MSGIGIGKSLPENQLRSIKSATTNTKKIKNDVDLYDIDDVTQGELTLDYEISEPKCNGI